MKIAIYFLIQIYQNAMKYRMTNKIKDLHLKKQSTLASALSLALFMPSFAIAQENNSVDTITIKDKAQTIENLNSFVVEANHIIHAKSTQKYLTNRHFADSSTFPLNLLYQVKKNPWKPAPYLPIAKEDMDCYFGIPPYKEPEQFDYNTTPINVTSDDFSGDIKNEVTYKGNVLITQGDNELRSDTTSYNKESATLTSKGNISYKTGAFTVNSKDRIVNKLKDKVTTLYDAVFTIHGSIVSGSAKEINVDREQKKSTIKDLVLSTCPGDSKIWKLKAGEVKLKDGEAFGETYDNTFYIKDVPVMWVPYANFPITNVRQSGLLYPSFSISSSNGFDYSQPIYLNLAPNYDMTLTPRVMTKRGVALDTEFRIMPIKDTLSTLEFNYIPHDNAFDLLDDNERWFFRYKQISDFYNGDLNLDIDYSRVRPGDYDYLSDIGAEDTNVTDDNLEQHFIGTFDRDNLNVKFILRKYQSLLPNEVTAIKPFSVLPQITSFYNYTFEKWNFNLDSNLTSFNAPNDFGYSNSFSTQRAHIEPSIIYQAYNNNGTFLNLEGRYFFTYYNQDSLDNLPEYYRNELGFSHFESEETRNLYLLQVHAKTTLERKVLDLRHTQTLEPEIQYRYIPYENQDDIGLYDTTDRLNDYYSNFSWRKFTGLDRIADTNAVTMGFTTRLLDPHDRELYRLALSQTYSFVPSRVILDPAEESQREVNPRSPLSLEFNANPIKEITAHAEATYLNETNSISAWNAMMQYENRKGYLTQVNYRYAKDGNFVDNVDLSQIGIQFIAPLGSQLKLISAAYYDLEQHNNIDSKIALSYDDCCYRITFMFENYSKTDWKNLSGEHETVFGVQFELKGLGAFNISGADNPNSTDTYLLPHYDPTNLNR